VTVTVRPTAASKPVLGWATPRKEDTNQAFDEILAAGPDAMLNTFDTTALRLGTAFQKYLDDKHLVLRR
jgi:hypothetical protein